MGELGFLGITAEPEYGGTGGTYLDHCIIMEEISRQLRLGCYLRTAVITVHFALLTELLEAWHFPTEHIPIYASIS